MTSFTSRCRACMLILFSSLVFGCGEPRTVSVLFGKMPDLTSGEAADCRISLSIQTDHGGETPGSVVVIKTIAPDDIEVQPKELKATLDESGRATIHLKVKLLDPNAKPGGRKIRMIFQHPSGPDFEETFTVNVS